MNAIPRATARERAFAADLVGTGMSAPGKAVSSQNRLGDDEGERLAVAIGVMICGYLERSFTPRDPLSFEP